MFLHSHRLLAGLVVGGGLLLAGCSTNSKAPQSTLMPTTQGVMCTKCQMTWVKVPVEGGKGRIVGYTTRKQMECPDCKDAVASFFATAKLQHTCKTCGDSMEICEAHGS
jgi:nitrous oxide reductase accessory protein NosL